MKNFGVLLFCLFVGVASAKEMPVIERLSSDSFEEREKAQKEIYQWVLANHEGAKELLLQKFLKSESPEIKTRLVPILERAYFEIKGYVGIIMVPFEPVGESVAEGVQIVEVLPETPAATCGLKQNDVILKINDWDVKGLPADLTSKVADEIQRKSPLTPVALKVKRGAELIEIELKLAILPVPRERVREMVASSGNNQRNVSELDLTELRKEVKEFQLWLAAEIEKERKNLIADRRF